ncbi:hypothetical protein PRIPAC_95709 [Pristionchus pacificus]|uniref:Peptidase n=1 Tax=Pristionchus pacificus TaxID=54126 RepID=A0A2A6BXN2_PRIPA|nr:hypothetical protein PRIPAC_95709 [Pristionchus pacificus]|eukprot:PDM70684.1 Peptidase [Pristionchus pacificus]
MIYQLLIVSLIASLVSAQNFGNNVIPCGFEQLAPIATEVSTTAAIAAANLMPCGEESCLRTLPVSPLPMVVHAFAVCSTTDVVGSSLHTSVKMSHAVSIALKITALVLLLGVLGVSIGVLIVDLNIQSDIEATPAAPANFKNIPDGEVIQQADKRFSKFQQISDLYESWMDITADPCDDFYHYVCGNGQTTKLQSPFTISQNKDDDVIARMWNAPSSYWNAAPLPVKQAKWIVDKCHNDNSYTLADQQKKIKTMLQDYIGYTTVNVPFLYPNKATVMDKTALSKLLGYGKGQYGAFALLTSFVSTDFKKPDIDPYLFYVDQPLPIFIDSVYTDDAYPTQKDALVTELVTTMKSIAAKLGVTITDDDTLKKMAGDMCDFDRVISQTMQQDPIVRRQVERNYNPNTLADLNKKTDQFDWVPYIQSAMTLLGDRKTADGNTKVIIMEEDITLNLLNALVKKTDKVTVANYVYWKTLSQILTAVPPPTGHKDKANPMDKFRAVLNTDKRTLTGMLRKPDTADTNDAPVCTAIVQALLPWAASRMYVDTDIPNKDTRQTLKKNVAEIANWIFFGFRSQLDQLNWMDDTSKQGAFDKLNKIQLNVAYPDWGLDITADDNFMNQWIKLTNYLRLQQVLPLLDAKPVRDRTDFSSFIGITNAWYQPQMNSITFPEGILQEPFYSPDFPLATIFGGLGSISGHELTHGFDDQGVQWDGIGALNAWMSPDSQKDFNKMAQCVIDEYSSFCPFPGVCVNGANTQGENIADNGGIQAAYKALKAYESLKGADPRLPGFGSSFSSDQLFFLTFGQTWCDKEQSEDSFKKQIAGDVHSPAIYRVLGTIQNFPAFRNAFNCPVGKKYTPADHCDVWTSVPFK